MLRNSDRTPLLGGNVILAEPPADLNISITLLTLKDPFATRADIVRRIESGMSPGSEWSGYLLEDHYTTMRSLSLFQRPGTAQPAIGRTYLLIYNEGLSTERRQRVRIKAADTQQRMFTEIGNDGKAIDFAAQVTSCELFDGLMYDYPGSPPKRTFARDTTKTKIRETVYSDSGMFYGASRLTQATLINDVWLKVASVYTQIVPNSRTEVAAVDQYPGARQTVTLASTPREIKVGITPHTQRIRIFEENSGMVYVTLLKPAPAPGTVFVDFWALGQRYTLTDDGEGRMTGQGSGSVNYLTGALNLTLKNLPDVGSSITISHGEKSAYTNRSGQAGYRAPEFAWGTPQAPLKPGTVVVTWMSGGVLKTATDNGSGIFTGSSATGEINYAAGKIILRPTAMIDPGGVVKTDYSYTTQRTENFTSLSVDAGGFAAITLQAAPVPRSVKVEWVTVRNVSASAGTSDFVSNNGTDEAAITETRTQTVFNPDPPTVVPPTYTAPADEPSRVFPAVPDPMGWEVGAVAERSPPGQTVHMVLQTSHAHGNGAFRWVLVHISGGSLESAFPTLSGTVYVAENAGYFDIPTLATTPADVFFHVRVEQELGGALVAISPVTQTIDVPEVPAPAPAPAPSPSPAPAPAPASDWSPYSTVSLYQSRYGNPPWSAGEKRWLEFKGPVTGAYLWDVLTPNPEAFVATQGSFNTTLGKGGFWLEVRSDAIDTNFVVRVKNQYDVVLVANGSWNVDVANPAPTLTPTLVDAPTAGIKVRDPISTGGTVPITSGSNTVAGMFAGGVDGTGKTVYVAAAPENSELWGDFYDPPAKENEVWSPEEMQTGYKVMESRSGRPFYAYQLWNRYAAGDK